MEQKEQKQPLSEQELEQVSGGGLFPRSQIVGQYHQAELEQVSGWVIPRITRMVCPLCNRYVTHLKKHQESGCSDYRCEGTPTIVF